LNVPYYGTSESNNIDLIGCRQMVPGDLDQVLTPIIARRCASCHEPTRQIYTRITNVENNSFLLAPLARSAAGPNGAENRSSPRKMILITRQS